MTGKISRLRLGFLLERRVRLRIGAVTLAAGTAAAIFSLLSPNWYQSVLSVAPAKAPKGGGISSLLGSDMGALTAGLDLPGASADGGRIAAVLQSVRVTDGLIQKLELQQRYRQKYIEGAREALWQHCEVKQVTRANLVQVKCEDKDPAFAQRMLTLLAQLGNEAFRDVSLSSAGEEVRFLEKRVAELREQADASAARMQAFQEERRIIDLDAQAKAVVGALAELNHQRISKQLELELARTFAAGDEPGARQLQSQLSVVTGRQRDLEEPASAASNGGARSASARGVFPPALAVPQLRAQYEKLLRERKVSEATLVVALERLENARADQARDVSTFVVLDPATLPTRKTRPQRTVFTLAVTMLAFLGAVVFEAWKSGELAALLAAANAAEPAPSPPKAS